MPSTLHAQAKSPHIVAVCVGTAVAGTFQLALGEIPLSIQSAVPGYISHMWSILLVLGGITALVGIYIPDPILGLRLEAAGHIGIAGGCSVYVGALITWVEVLAWAQPVVWWSLAIAVASVYRWFQIWHVIHKAERLAQEMVGESNG